MPTTKSEDYTLSETDKEDLISRIRKRFDYMVEGHRKNRDEGCLDMQALSPLGPWLPAEREKRRSLKRACIHLDQLNQYANMLINEFRQSPIGIEITPEGGGADDETATLRADRLRNLEEKSNATKRAYLPALEGSVQRGYGAFGIITEEISSDDWDQTIKWRGFPNPDAVLWDPDAKELDCSDMEDCFVLDEMERETAKSKYGDKAEKASFGTDYLGVAPKWGTEAHVQIAEYWYKKYRNRTVYRVRKTDDEGKVTDTKVYKDELPDGVKESSVEGTKALVEADGTHWAEILQGPKKARIAQICQCMTNGVDVWDHIDWPGSWIPIIPMLGKVKYVREWGSSNVEQVTESYIRNARDAAMMYDYYKTGQVELVSMTPKTPHVAVKGQLEGLEDKWVQAMDEPVAYLEYHAITDATGNTILPPPQRQSYSPEIERLEIGAESARRAIQAALGSYGFTKQDDTNVKSGIAIERLNRQSESGAYHFIDNAKISIQHGGRIANELLDIIEDNKREVGLTKEDGTRKVVRLNEKYQDDDGEHEYKYRNTDDDKHDVVVSTRDSGQTRHEEQQVFLSNLVQSPNPLISLAALREAIRYHQLGPLEAPLLEAVDAIIAIQAPGLSKDKAAGQVPPEIQAKMQQMEQVVQELQGALKEAEFKLAAKQAENEGKLAIEQARAQGAAQKTAQDNEGKLALQQQKLTADAQITQADNAAEMAKVDQQTATQKAVTEIRGQFDIILQQMKAEFQRELEAFKAAQAEKVQQRQIDAGDRQQAVEIENRPEPKAGE